MKRPVAFGLNVDPSARDPQSALRIAAIADESGLEYAGVQDHPYNPGFTDTLAHITWLAARTSQVRFFTNVADLPLRPPAMLAKQAATIDLLSGGRFELGIGAGAYWDGIAFWPEDDRERQSRIFAEEVVPAVRTTLGDAATGG